MPTNDVVTFPFSDSTVILTVTFVPIGSSISVDPSLRMNEKSVVPGPGRRKSSSVGPAMRQRSGGVAGLPMQIRFG